MWTTNFIPSVWYSELAILIISIILCITMLILLIVFLKNNSRKINIISFSTGILQLVLGLFLIINFLVNKDKQTTVPPEETMYMTMGMLMGFAVGIVATTCAVASCIFYPIAYFKISY